MGNKVTKKVLVDENQLLRAEIVRLNLELGGVNTLVSRLQGELTGAMMHEQTIAQKFRDTIAALDSEVKLAQRGLTSGCGCPIGKCIRKNGDSGSCWMQWAESLAVKRAAERLIDGLVRHAHHPGRFNQGTNALTHEEG